jgi:predicted MFS family arabinose efflux permease
MMWGLFPILMAVRGFGIAEIGIVTGVYPAVWGMGQLITGKMADHFNKRHILVVGMLLQGAALFSFPFVSSLSALISLAAVLGWGTAMVYPTFLAAIAENTHPTDRAASLGVFRLWRDLGYAIGAILTGIIADTLGMASSVFVVAALTTISAGVIFVRMRTELD